MIAHLTGRLAFKAPTHLALDVHGVGYEVFIPLSTYYNLPNVDESLTLSIHTHVREDAIQLFGFSSRQEKDAFVLLMSVSGIGPKSALGILSALPVADLASAIQSGDVEKLETVPGIGKKSAGRLVLELKDKLIKIHPGLMATVDQSIAGSDDVFRGDTPQSMRIRWSGSGISGRRVSFEATPVSVHVDGAMTSLTTPFRLSPISGIGQQTQKTHSKRFGSHPLSR
jgi:Holliday junction DNA helicase RuvA